MKLAAWRVGAKVPLNVYEGDRPVCQCHSPKDAQRIVAAMNALAAPKAEERPRCNADSGTVGSMHGEMGLCSSCGEGWLKSYGAPICPGPEKKARRMKNIEADMHIFPAYAHHTTEPHEEILEGHPTLNSCAYLGCQPVEAATKVVLSPQEVRQKAEAMLRTAEAERDAAREAAPVEPEPPKPVAVEPPNAIIQFAIEAANSSPCRSKRGAAIFRGDDLVSVGKNNKSLVSPCDGSEVCKSGCRRSAVHAEQAALLHGDRVGGASMLHVKTVDGRLVASGEPSCLECSKLILESGISWMWLYHKTGWKRYTAEDFHRVTLAHVEPPKPDLLVQQPGIEVEE